MDITAPQLGITEIAILEGALADAQTQLSQAALEETFEGHLSQAFGSLFEPAAATQLKHSLGSGQYNWPRLEVLSHSALQGAAGAYAAQTQTIYLSAEFIQANAATPSHITAVLLEEIGHDLDRQLNPHRDSPGDEGEIFSALVRGETLSPAKLAELRSQNDQASIWLDGIETSIETATTDSIGSGQAFNHQSPFGTLNYAIALQGTFPSRSLSADPMLGAVMQFAGNFAPRGWALANGQTLSISENTALFSILGTTYGGDGRTTFALPDLRGRTPIGTGTGAGLSTINLGQRGGTETTTLNSLNLPSHSHSITDPPVTTSVVGNSQSFSNRDPYLGLTPVINLEGSFPVRNNLTTFSDIGTISWFAGNFAPRGWAKAEGQLIDIADNNALFAILGDTFGGDGRTTFALPDLRGRAAVHFGSGPGLSPISLGEQGGTETTTLNINNLPAHDHAISTDPAISTNSIGNGQSFNHRSPYLGVNYQLALTGIFPSRNGLDADENNNDSPDEQPQINGLLSGNTVLDQAVALATIQSLAQAAISQWQAAGISNAQVAQLESVTYEIADLEPGNLAFAGDDHRVIIDADASSRGWFIDETPWEHSEFGSTDPRTGELLATDPTALGDFDLLTAILHEQGHILGFSHTPEPGAIMYGALGTGGRILATAADVVEPSHDHDDDAYLLGQDAIIAGVGIFGGNFEVRDFNQTDGQLITVGDNDPLFSLIGTTYGGDGRTTFGVPDFRGRSIIHAGQGPGLSDYSEGQTGGAETTTLAIANLPAHTHSFNAAPIITTATTVDAAENQITVTNVDATDDTDSEGSGLTYSLTGGADQALFTLDSSSGALAFATTPDFETPGDADGNNDYLVQVTVSDSGSLTAVQDLTISLTNINESPIITTATTVEAAENQTTVIDVNATDDTDGEGSGLTYSLTGGADQALFTLDSSSGALAFATAPDFETPGDADGNNDFLVQVTVTDAGNLAAVQDLTVSVTNINEAPSVLAPNIVNVPEDSSPGQLLAIVSSQDVDGPDSIFSISFGNDDGLFAINNAGEIRLANNAQLDFETGPTTYALTIKVEEASGTNPLSVLTPLSINITDVFEPATPAAIAWDTDTGTVSAFTINTATAAALQAPIDRTITDPNWELQTTGDLNGDGQDDVILRHGLAGQNLVWTMAAGGQSISSEALVGRNVPDVNWRIVGASDLDSDGNVDIVLRNQVADQTLAWYMDGSGNILSEDVIGRAIGDANWEIVAVTDFNNDRKADLLLRNSLAGQNLLWEMDGATILGESLLGREVADPNWHIEGARDFDNNGTTDVFLRHRGVGQGLLWSMANTTDIAAETIISNIPNGQVQLIL